MQRTVAVLAALVLCALIAAPASASNTNSTDVATPTFHGQVSRILQSECQVCHRPNGANLGGMVAPMALVTYEQTRPWARSIARKAQSREMPPWHASADQAGLFRNERTMTDEQIDTLVRWAKGGAPAGDPANAPEPREWPAAGGWMIGEPDLILTVDEPYFVKDDVEDEYIYLKTTMTKELLPRDRMVKAVEFRPGSAAVHHIIVPSLGGIAPGNDPTIYSDGIGSKLAAGRDLQWQMHYHKEPGEGTGVWDQSQVAIKFYDDDEEVRHTLQNAGLSRFDFAIPPGAKDVTTTAEHVFQEDAKIVSYLPHMHLRGKAAKYTAYYPNGTSEVLLDVPKYDFNWQTAYEYTDYKSVPKGTKVVFQSWWDNSADNPHNPDPTVTVRWGEPTTDEMSFGFLGFINDSNTGGNPFGTGSSDEMDMTAVVAFLDENRDGLLQKDEAPEQLMTYWTMIDRNKDDAVDMDEARAANEAIKRMGMARGQRAKAPDADTEASKEANAGDR